MFDLIINEDDTELVRLEKRIMQMALDLTKLNASVDRSTAASEAALAEVAKLVAAGDNTADQATVNAVADKVDTESAKVEAALAALNPVVEAPAA